MKNPHSPALISNSCCKHSCTRSSQFVVLVLVVVVTLFTSRAALGQKEGPRYITSVSTQSSATSTSISIDADGSLRRAQTWQDGEGFHVIVPEAIASEQIRTIKGIEVREIGTSIEILVRTRSGATVQSGDNRLTLVFDGKLDIKDLETEPTVEPPAPRSTPRQAGGNSTQVQGNAPDANGDDEGSMSSVVSGTSAVLVLGLGAVVFLVFRVGAGKWPLRHVHQSKAEPENSQAIDFDDGLEKESGENTRFVPVSPPSPVHADTRKAAARLPVAIPTTLFGAFKIDEEVGKLVTGQAHRMDVLSSRVSDDRRAIEASLIKTVNGNDSSEDERLRARSALEEYGFVARQCATLLLAAEPFDRTSAARSLGEIGSPTALPFLLEALYDTESIVRNQAVVSIGELKVPSAIGALLDMARNHPAVPSSLISRALSACSVEGFDFVGGGLAPQGSYLNATSVLSPGMEMHLESTSSVEELPETSDEAGLSEALQSLNSGDANERSEAVANLAQYRVHNAVVALTEIARNDSEPLIRAEAISSLASINHESIFSVVLIAMADDAKEVRTAAARSLSRLSFDCADAYARLLETANAETLAEVAQACIKAGIVFQNIERLANDNRRQVYEAFALVSLLSKARMTEPVIDAIKNHKNLDVRVNAVHLLANTGHPDVLEHLRELSTDKTLPEELSTALLNAISRLEQRKRKVENPVEQFTVHGSELEKSAEIESQEFENSADNQFHERALENSAVDELCDNVQFSFSTPASEVKIVEM